jgi:hypothetical protein
MMGYKRRRQRRTETSSEGDHGHGLMDEWVDNFEDKTRIIKAINLMCM